MKQQRISKRVNFQRAKRNMPQIANGKMQNAKAKCPKSKGKKAKGQKTI